MQTPEHLLQHELADAYDADHQFLLATTSLTADDRIFPTGRATARASWLRPSS